ncbi:MAG: hypothetical protein ACJ75S_05815 [Solirubrobacterales bacterium]
MTRRAASLAVPALIVLLLAAPGAVSAAENCGTEPRPACFGIEAVKASLSTMQAGAHPDVSLDIGIKQNPSSPTNVFGLHDSYAATRNIRFDLPPGLVGDPNAIGAVQQCSVEQLSTFNEPGGGCPNGSQIGVSDIFAYELTAKFHEPLYMMEPPGGDVVARVGTVAGIFPTFIDFRVRSESDYGIVGEVVNASAVARLVKLESDLWGVPASPVHDTERCTAAEAFEEECEISEERPPGGNENAFFTNPTRCRVPLSVGVSAASWSEPELTAEKGVTASLGEIEGCDRLLFGPGLEVEPTSHHTSTPTGLAMTFKLPAAKSVKVLEPSQVRYMKIDLPEGFAVNTDSADGLETCSAKEVGFSENVASECPDGAKLAATEFDIPVLERKLKGAIYLREQEPEHPYRIWIVADDLGLHVKLPGELELDKETGQIHSIVVGTPETEGIPQAPLREVKLLFKSGFRAPLVTPSKCGTYLTHYEFIPWSGGPPAIGNAPMQIDEGCESGGFAPRLSAGSTNPQGGAYSPFNTTITREDSEQNIAGLALKLPRGLAASFAGIPHCEGLAAETGACSSESRIGKVVAAVGVGPAPLWVPQAGKRPTAVYLGGPYKGAPTSIVSVVPKQAGPFDFGDEVVRTAVYVDPVTAQATAQADPLPQLVEGTPLFYKTINIQLDRPHFALNPTSCARKETVANLASTGGKSASPTSSYAATGCGRLAFAPRISFRLRGATHRGASPRLKATVRMPSGGANIGASTVIMPRSLQIEQGHFRTICTRVQFAAHECPEGSTYGTAKATSPLLDQPLEGPVYLRSSSHTLPDVVAVLKGPPSFPLEIDVDGHVDSVYRRLPNGETIGFLRTTFETVPDAPVSQFTIDLRGGKAGILVNSTGLCLRVNRATAKFTAQNGKAVTLHPVMKNSCKKKSRRPR